MRIAALLLLSAMACTADAQSTSTTAAHDHHAAPPANPATLLPPETKPAIAVVEAFGKALAAGDFNTVESLLDSDVLILESGGAERSRAEYLGHHAIADAKFLKTAHLQPGRRQARVHGDLAWVGSESELHVSKDGKPMTVLSTETMVLSRTGDGWRIVHIHWSSRPKS